MENIVFALLLIHGLGHLLGVVASFRRSRWENWNADSWLLGKIIDMRFLKSMASVMFLIPALASIAAAFIIKGYLFEVTEWRAVIMFAAVSSLVAIAIFPKALFTTFNRVAAIALNVLILVILYKEPFLSITF